MRKILLNKFAASITLASFIFTTIGNDIFIGASYAAQVPPSAKAAPHKFDIEKLEIPSRLGEIKGVWPSTERGTRDERRGTIIHIQDAHCNYSAQRSIAETINHLNTAYGVKLVALEGGKGNYDLSIFTKIANPDIRDKVSDLFVKEGRVTGAEYYAINNPGKVTLYGIEDEKLYFKNLDAYRDSLLYKEEIDKCLNTLTHIVNNLKLNAYSRELKELDAKSRAYQDKKIEFKNYIKYLTDKAERKRLLQHRSARLRNDELPLSLRGASPAVGRQGDEAISKYPNIASLANLLKDEEEIDFNKANKERSNLIDKLGKAMPKSELEELVKKSAEFSSGLITNEEYHTHIFRKAKLAGVDFNNLPNLVKYSEYVKKYEAIDKIKLFEELKALEEALFNSIAGTDDQKTIYKLDRNLSIMKGMFAVSLVKDEYDYYIKNKDEFFVKTYIDFLNKKGSIYKLNLKVGESINGLDTHLENMERFYECSLKRDEAFVKNIELKLKKEKTDTAILVTGGFHSDNLKKLLNDKGYTYIEVMPRIKSSEDENNPYFNLLNGGYTAFEEFLIKAIATRPQTSNLAIGTPFSEMGIMAARPDDYKTLLELEVKLRAILEEKRDCTIKTRWGHIRISRHGQSPDTREIIRFEYLGGTYYASIFNTPPTRYDIESDILIMSIPEMSLRPPKEDRPTPESLRRSASGVASPIDGIKGLEEFFEFNQLTGIPMKFNPKKGKMPAEMLMKLALVLRYGDKSAQELASDYWITLLWSVAGIKGLTSHVREELYGSDGKLRIFSDYFTYGAGSTMVLKEGVNASSILSAFIGRCALDAGHRDDIGHVAGECIKCVVAQSASEAPLHPVWDRIRRDNDNLIPTSISVGVIASIISLMNLLANPPAIPLILPWAVPITCGALAAAGGITAGLAKCFGTEKYYTVSIPTPIRELIADYVEGDFGEERSFIAAKKRSSGIPIFVEMPAISNVLDEENIPQEQVAPLSRAEKGMIRSIIKKFSGGAAVYTYAMPKNILGAALSRVSGKIDYQRLPAAHDGLYFYDAAKEGTNPIDGVCITGIDTRDDGFVAAPVFIAAIGSCARRLIGIVSENRISVYGIPRQNKTAISAITRIHDIARTVTGKVNEQYGNVDTSAVYHEAVYRILGEVHAGANELSDRKDEIIERFRNDDAPFSSVADDKHGKTSQAAVQRIMADLGAKVWQATGDLKSQMESQLHHANPLKWAKMEERLSQIAASDAEIDRIAGEMAAFLAYSTSKPAQAQVETTGPITDTESAGPNIIISGNDNTPRRSASGSLVVSGDDKMIILRAAQSVAQELTAGVSEGDYSTTCRAASKRLDHLILNLTQGRFHKLPETPNEIVKILDVDKLLGDENGIGRIVTTESGLTSDELVLKLIEIAGSKVFETDESFIPFIDTDDFTDTLFKYTGRKFHKVPELKAAFAAEESAVKNTLDKVRRPAPEIIPAVLRALLDEEGRYIANEIAPESNGTAVKIKFANPENGGQYRGIKISKGRRGLYYCTIFYIDEKGRESYPYLPVSSQRAGELARYIPAALDLLKDTPSRPQWNEWVAAAGKASEGKGVRHSASGEQLVRESDSEKVMERMINMAEKAREIEKAKEDNSKIMAAILNMIGSLQKEGLKGASLISKIEGLNEITAPRKLLDIARRNIVKIGDVMSAFSTLSVEADAASVLKAAKYVEAAGVEDIYITEGPLKDRLDQIADQGRRAKLYHRLAQEASVEKPRRSASGSEMDDNEDANSRKGSAKDSKAGISRRDFLKTSALSAALLAAGGPEVSSSKPVKTIDYTKILGPDHPLFRFVKDRKYAANLVALRSDLGWAEHYGGILARLGEVTQEELKNGALRNDPYFQMDTLLSSLEGSSGKVDVISYIEGQMDKIRTRLGYDEKWIKEGEGLSISEEDLKAAKEYFAEHVLQPMAKLSDTLRKSGHTEAADGILRGFGREELLKLINPPKKYGVIGTSKIKRAMVPFAGNKAQWSRYSVNNPARVVSGDWKDVSDEESVVAKTVCEAASRAGFSKLYDKVLTEHGEEVFFKIDFMQSKTSGKRCYIRVGISDTPPVLEKGKKHSPFEGALWDFEYASVSLSVPVGELASYLPVEIWGKSINPNFKSWRLDKFLSKLVNILEKTYDAKRSLELEFADNGLSYEKAKPRASASGSVVPVDDKLVDRTVKNFTRIGIPKLCYETKIIGKTVYVTDGAEERFKGGHSFKLPFDIGKHLLPARLGDSTLTKTLMVHPGALGTEGLKWAFKHIGAISRFLAENYSYPHKDKYHISFEDATIAVSVEADTAKGSTGETRAEIIVVDETYHPEADSQAVSPEEITRYAEIAKTRGIRASALRHSSGPMVSKAEPSESEPSALELARSEIKSRTKQVKRLEVEAQKAQEDYQRACEQNAAEDIIARKLEQLTNANDALRTNNTKLRIAYLRKSMLEPGKSDLRRDSASGAVLWPAGPAASAAAASAAAAIYSRVLKAVSLEDKKDIGAAISRLKEKLEKVSSIEAVEDVLSRIRIAHIKSAVFSWWGPHHDTYREAYLLTLARREALRGQPTGPLFMASGVGELNRYFPVTARGEDDIYNDLWLARSMSVGPFMVFEREEGGRIKRIVDFGPREKKLKKAFGRGFETRAAHKPKIIDQLTEWQIAIIGRATIAMNNHEWPDLFNKLSAAYNLLTDEETRPSTEDIELGVNAIAGICFALKERPSLVPVEEYMKLPQDVRDYIKRGFGIDIASEENRGSASGAVEWPAGAAFEDARAFKTYIDQDMRRVGKKVVDETWLRALIQERPAAINIIGARPIDASGREAERAAIHSFVSGEKAAANSFVRHNFGEKDNFSISHAMVSIKDTVEMERAIRNVLEQINKNISKDKIYCAISNSVLEKINEDKELLKAMPGFGSVYEYLKEHTMLTIVNDKAVTGAIYGLPYGPLTLHGLTQLNLAGILVDKEITEGSDYTQAVELFIETTALVTNSRPEDVRKILAEKLAAAGNDPVKFFVDIPKILALPECREIDWAGENDKLKAQAEVLRAL